MVGGDTDWYGGGGDDTDQGLSALLRRQEAPPPGLAQGFPHRSSPQASPLQPPSAPLLPPAAYRHSGSCVLSLMEQVPPFRQ